MTKLCLTLFTVLLVTGCASVVTPLDEGYQLGDTSQSVAALRGDYCTEVTPLARLGLQRLVSKASEPIPFSFCP